MFGEVPLGTRKPPIFTQAFIRPRFKTNFPCFLALKEPENLGSANWWRVKTFKDSLLITWLWLPYFLQRYFEQHTKISTDFENMIWGNLKISKIVSGGNVRSNNFVNLRFKCAGPPTEYPPTPAPTPPTHPTPHHPHPNTVCNTCQLEHKRSFKMTKCFWR